MAEQGPLGWAITICKSADDPYTCGCDSPLEADCDDVVVEVVPRSEYERLREALRRILDHGETHDEPCWAIHNGDCADTMQEIARAALVNTNEVKCTCAFEPGDNSSCERHPE